MNRKRESVDPEESNCGSVLDGGTGDVTEWTGDDTSDDETHDDGSGLHSGRADEIEDDDGDLRTRRGFSSQRRCYIQDL